LFTGHHEQIVALAARYAVPAVYQWPQFTAAGGLMSYGASRIDAFRHVGVYTGRILKGEKPSDLPVQQATRISLSINLKTAKALNLSIPISINAARRRGDRIVGAKIAAVQRLPVMALPGPYPGPRLTSAVRIGKRTFQDLADDRYRRKAGPTAL
jgi:hypothetical protein